MSRRTSLPPRSSCELVCARASARTANLTALGMQLCLDRQALSRPPAQGSAEARRRTCTNCCVHAVGDDVAYACAGLALQSFLASAGLPDYLQISREIDGGETAVFKEYFHVFDPPVSLSVADRIVRSVLTPPASMHVLRQWVWVVTWRCCRWLVVIQAAAGSGEAKAEAAADGEVSVTFLPGQAPSERMVDDGSGTLTIWRVEGMALVRCWWCGFQGLPGAEQPCECLCDLRPGGSAQGAVRPILRRRCLCAAVRLHQRA